MATLNELLGDASVVDKTLVISNDFRTINIPSSVPNLGVEYDDDVLRLEFKMPRYVSDTDLSAFSVRINYMNAQRETDTYTVSDALVGNEYITFSWRVGPTATRYKGNTKFIVCAKTIKPDGTVDKEFNTTIATLPVLEGLEVDESIVTEYSDIIEQWRQELFGIGDTEEASIKAVSKTEQAAIENKGAEVLATIPEDYQTAVSMTDNADRTKADAIVCESHGEIVCVHDSSDDYLRGLRVFGKTTQVTTTGTQLFNPYATQNTSFGTALVENNGARITVTGTYYVSWPITLKAGVTYYINFKTVGNATNRAIRFEYPDKEITETITNPASFTPTKDTVSVYLYSGLGTEGTITYKDVHISEGFTAIPWEPFSGGVASPSPAWPQELSNVENPTINIFNKNLWSIDHIELTGGSRNDVLFEGRVPLPVTMSWVQDFARTTGSALFGYVVDGETYFSASAEAPGFFQHVIHEGKYLEKITLLNWAPETGNLTNIQLELGSDATMYERYTPRQSIKVNKTLSGVPVTQNGNYTDETGQQWVCDEIDFDRGVYIKRVGTKVFDGSTDEIWHDELVLDNTVMFRIEIADSVNIGNVVGKDYLCSNFQVKNMYNSDVEGTQHTMKQFYFRLNKSTLATADLDGFRAYLAEKPMTVQYVLANPIEIPLTAEEIEWFRFAHTNFPNTTVLNDAGATMELVYNADTKLWMDNLPKVTDEQAGPLVEAWMDEHFTDAEGVVYGKSAYEIAVERGFQGSEEYWLTTLKGRDGDPGYVPVKGVDYFTQADKDEIAGQITPEDIGAATKAEVGDASAAEGLYLKMDHILGGVYRFNIDPFNNNKAIGETLLIKTYMYGDSAIEYIDYETGEETVLTNDAADIEIDPESGIFVCEIPISSDTYTASLEVPFTKNTYFDKPIVMIKLDSVWNAIGKALGEGASQLDLWNAMDELYGAMVDYGMFDELSAEFYAHIEDEELHGGGGVTEDYVSKEDLEIALGDYLHLADWEQHDPLGQWNEEGDTSYRVSASGLFMEYFIERKVTIDPANQDLVYLAFLYPVLFDGCHYSVTIEGPDRPFVTGCELEIDPDIDTMVCGLNVYFQVDTESTTTVTIKAHIFGNE